MNYVFEVSKSIQYFYIVTKKKKSKNLHATSIFKFLIYRLLILKYFIRVRTFKTDQFEIYLITQ